MPSAAETAEKLAGYAATADALASDLTDRAEKLVGLRPVDRRSLAAAIAAARACAAQCRFLADRAKGNA